MLRRSVLAAGPMLMAAPRLGHGQRAQPLRFVPFADLTVTDPHATTSYVTRNHALMVFDTLFALDAQMRPQPQMLEGFTTSPDGLRWTLTLRPGLRFHDGEPVLARDVVASLARWGRADGFGQILYAATDEVTAPDDRTVVFRLKRPFPHLPAALAKVTTMTPSIMPARLCGGPPNVPVREVVGSGPFRYVPADSLSGDRYAYERFAGYVPRQEAPSFTAGAKRALIERVEFRIIPDASTATNALTRGEIDWYDQIQPDQIPPLRRNRALVVEPCESTGYVGFLVMNHRLPPFDNPAVRQAVLAAVNQADYGTAVMGDDPTLWKGGLGYFCPGTPLASSAGIPAAADLEAAKRMLAATGAAGTKITMLNATDVGFVSAMNMVAIDAMKRLGFEVEVLESDIATFAQRRLRPDGWNAYAIGAIGLQTLDPAVNTYLRGDGRPFGFTRSEALEGLRDEWMAAPDLATQQAKARAMQAAALRDLPYIPVGQYLVQTAYRGNIRRGVKEMSVFWELERG